MMAFPARDQVALPPRGCGCALSARGPVGTLSGNDGGEPAAIGLVAVWASRPGDNSTEAGAGGAARMGWTACIIARGAAGGMGERFTREDGVGASSLLVMGVAEVSRGETDGWRRHGS